MSKESFIKIVVGLIFIFFIIFGVCAYKKIKSGNNESNKSAKQITEYILNINSYKAEIEVTINSNKNVNKYLLKQEYNSNNDAKQTVIKPENIEGVEVIYKDGDMIINNSKMNLSKIYNNYPYLSDNVLWLSSFVEKYREQNENAKVYEQDNNVVIEVKLQDNAYLAIEKLYLEKGTGKPKKMEVIDNNKNTIVYILYKEIDIKK